MNIKIKKQNKNNIVLFLQLILLVFFVLIAIPKLAIAVDASNVAKPLADFVYCYIDRILRFLIELAGVGTVIMIVVGGFFYITSSGDPGKLKKASGAITAAVVGLCITSLSFALMFFVGTKVDPNFSWSYEMVCSYPGKISLKVTPLTPPVVPPKPIVVSPAVTPPVVAPPGNPPVTPPIAPRGCLKNADIVLVLDRSTSIALSDLAELKSAMVDFVNTLDPTKNRERVAVVEFGQEAVLDLHLSGDTATINSTINKIPRGGSTNLQGALLLARQELSNSNYDRPDSESPDYVIIVTDGMPNTVNPGIHGDEAEKALEEAKAIKDAGGTIFTVGVSGATNVNYLKNEISSTSSNYYPITNYSGLATVMKSIAECKGSGMPNDEEEEDSPDGETPEDTETGGEEPVDPGENTDGIPPEEETSPPDESPDENPGESGTDIGTPDDNPPDSDQSTGTATYQPKSCDQIKNEMKAGSYPEANKLGGPGEGRYYIKGIDINQTIIKVYYKNVEFGPAFYDQWTYNYLKGTYTKNSTKISVDESSIRNGCVLPNYNPPAPTSPKPGTNTGTPTGGGGGTNTLPSPNSSSTCKRIYGSGKPGNIGIYFALNGFKDLNLKSGTSSMTFEDYSKAIIDKDGANLGFGYFKPYSDYLDKFDFYYITKPLNETEEKVFAAASDIVYDSSSGCNPINKNLFIIVFGSIAEEGIAGYTFMGSNVALVKAYNQTREASHTVMHEFSHMMGLGDESPAIDFATSSEHECPEGVFMNCASDYAEAKAKWGKYIGIKGSQGTPFEALEPNDANLPFLFGMGGKMDPLLLHPSLASLMNYNVQTMDYFQPSDYYNKQECYNLRKGLLDKLTSKRKLTEVSYCQIKISKELGKYALGPVNYSYVKDELDNLLK